MSYLFICLFLVLSNTVGDGAELFHTERSHVRNLKVLERVFYRPLLDHGYSDLVNLLFPNLPEMLDIHGRFNALMKARKREQPAVESVGDILVAMVSHFSHLNLKICGNVGPICVFSF